MKRVTMEVARRVMFPSRPSSGDVLERTLQGLEQEDFTPPVEHLSDLIEVLQGHDYPGTAILVTLLTRAICGSFARHVADEPHKRERRQLPRRRNTYGRRNGGGDRRDGPDSNRRAFYMYNIGGRRRRDREGVTS